MEQNGAAKRSRNESAGYAASKKLKLGQDVLPRPEGGVNCIEIDGKTCTHAVALPEGVPDASPLPPAPRPGPPAKEFPFVLDPFQRTAINCLEAGEPLQTFFQQLMLLDCLLYMDSNSHFT